MTSFHGVRGMIIMWTFLSLHGPFCRDCGIATFRRMTSQTLVAGWWGVISFFVNLGVVCANLASRQTVARLPAPTPPAYGPWERPMEHGRPVLARWYVIVMLVLLAFFVGSSVLDALLTPASHGY